MGDWANSRRGEAIRRHSQELCERSIALRRDWRQVVAGGLGLRLRRDAEMAAALDNARERLLEALGQVELERSRIGHRIGSDQGSLASPSPGRARVIAFRPREPGAGGGPPAPRPSS